jgi:hypothetical protein
MQSVVGTNLFVFEAPGPPPLFCYCNHLYFCSFFVTTIAKGNLIGKGYHGTLMDGMSNNVLAT